jgi:hypothetical protein
LANVRVVFETDCEERLLPSKPTLNVPVGAVVVVEGVRVSCSVTVWL